MIKEIDKLAWILIKHKKLLCVRSINKSLFYTPGGKREVGESDEEALTREIKEELMVDLIPNTINYANTFIAQADGKSDGIQVKLTCYFADYDGELTPDAEIEEMAWLNSSNRDKLSVAGKLVVDWLVTKHLIL